jgi:MFS family permease
VKRLLGNSISLANRLGSTEAVKLENSFTLRREPHLQMQNPSQTPTTISNPALLMSWPARFPIYFGWVQVVVAALAMLATLPGRTQGLGLITEPLLRDLRMDHQAFARINLWATLLGAIGCLGIGQLVDRLGTRLMLTVVVGALGINVLLMSHVTREDQLFITVTLTRALGQSALSVISIALVGKWFQRQISWAMAVYSVLVFVFFACAFGGVGYVVREEGWRTAWSGIGWVMLGGMLPVAILLTRNSPESCGLRPDRADETVTTNDSDFTLTQAMRTASFWIFALATSCYGLIVSGIGLFNESILAELGFDARVFHTLLAASALVALISQFVTGWLGTRWSFQRILAVALLLYGAALLWLPRVTTLAELWCNTILMGAAGGMITVVFFAIWPAVFGRRHLGKIQGAAQTLTVLTSALGPWIFAAVQKNYGSYAPILYGMAIPVLVLAVAVWRVTLPTRESPPSDFA